MGSEMCIRDSVSFRASLHGVDELVDRLQEVIAVKILSTFHSLEPVSYALPQTDEQPRIFVGLFPDLASEVIEGETGRQDLIDLISLLNDISGEQNLFIKNMDVVSVVHTLFGLFAPE